MLKLNTKFFSITISSIISLSVITCIAYNSNYTVQEFSENHLQGSHKQLKFQKSNYYTKTSDQNKKDSEFSLDHHTKMTDTSDYYYPRAELEYKGCTKRHIGRTAFLLPLYQKPQYLFFANVFGMADSKKNIEGNFGLGFRHKINESWIAGISGFYDIRRTASSNQIHQATFGLELMSRYFEIRGNIYLPKKEAFELRKIISFESRYNGHKTLYGQDNDSSYEVPLKGFDVEIGGCLPQFERFNLFGAYYHFENQMNKSSKHIDGVRGRGSLKLIDWFSLEGEINYDRTRKLTSYIGAKISYTFGKESQRYQNPLDNKMTQVVVRDIDAVTDKFDFDELTPILEADGFVPLLLTKEQGDALIRQYGKLKGETFFYDANDLIAEIKDKGTAPSNLAVFTGHGIEKLHDDDKDGSIKRHLSDIITNVPNKPALFEFLQEIPSQIDPDSPIGKHIAAEQTQRYRDAQQRDAQAQRNRDDQAPKEEEAPAQRDRDDREAEQRTKAEKERTEREEQERKEKEAREAAQRDKDAKEAAQRDKEKAEKERTEEEKFESLQGKVPELNRGTTERFMQWTAEQQEEEAPAPKEEEGSAPQPSPALAAPPAPPPPPSTIAVNSELERAKRTEQEAKKALAEEKRAKDALEREKREQEERDAMQKATETQAQIDRMKAIVAKNAGTQNVSEDVIEEDNSGWDDDDDTDPDRSIDTLSSPSSPSSSSKPTLHDDTSAILAPSATTGAYSQEDMREQAKAQLRQLQEQKEQKEAQDIRDKKDEEKRQRTLAQRNNQQHEIEEQSRRVQDAINKKVTDVDNKHLQAISEAAKDRASRQASSSSPAAASAKEAPDSLLEITPEQKSQLTTRLLSAIDNLHQTIEQCGRQAVREKWFGLDKADTIKQVCNAMNSNEPRVGLHSWLRGIGVNALKYATTGNAMSESMWASAIGDPSKYHTSYYEINEFCDEIEHIVLSMRSNNPFDVPEEDS